MTGPSGVEDSTLRDNETGVQLFFDSWESIENTVGGNAISHLKTAGDKLGVVFTVRDTCVRITSGDKEKLDRAVAFLNELIKLRDLCSSPLTPEEFYSALSDAAADRESMLRTFFTERISLGSKRHPVCARTKNQLAYLRAIRKHDVVFGIGPAGTGKTYLAMAMAVGSLLAGKCDRLILTRPAVEAGENLGFLPGKLEEKINPFLRPLYDALYDMMDAEEVAVLTDKGIMEVAPLAFMRGRTLNHAFIILDEAQNTTKEQMLMFLTRLGCGSKCVVCGDPTQTDLSRKQESGLLHAIARLRHIPEIGICGFSTEDVVRHSLVEKIIRAYDEKTKLLNKEQENG